MPDVTGSSKLLIHLEKEKLMFWRESGKGATEERVGEERRSITG